MEILWVRQAQRKTGNARWKHDTLIMLLFFYNEQWKTARFMRSRAHVYHFCTQDAAQCNRSMLRQKTRLPTLSMVTLTDHEFARSLEDANDHYGASECHYSTGYVCHCAFLR